MKKWLAIGALFFMLISYSIVSSLWLIKLQEQVEILQDDGKHYLHRLNSMEYWEVLPRRLQKSQPKKKGE